MKTENQFYQSLPSWAKGAVALAVIAGIGIIGFVIYKKVKSINEKSVSDETADSAEDEYIRLKKKGGAEGTLSYPQTKYFSAASAIKNALDGCDSKLGEKDAVNAVLGVVKKPIDWFYLVNVFGSRIIDDCGFGSETTYALPELLMEQLGHMAESFPPKNYIDVLRRELKKRGVDL